MPFYYDIRYMLVVALPAIILAGLAQMAVKSAFAKWSRRQNSSGRSGSEAAAYMLTTAGLGDVRVERTHGFLSDHYDPRTKTLRLSEQIYEGRSVAAVGIALHEAGHALQHAQGYAPLALRSAIVPVASIGGGYLPVILIVAGMAINALHGLALIGLALFAVAFAFTLVTLPVEFDASRRARQAAVQFGLVAPGPEAGGVAQVLNAAALTYLAASAAALLNLLYYAMIVFGRRDD